MTKDRPKTPNEWMAGYEARLLEGKGLTAREWDHVDELRRTLANRAASADRRMQTNCGLDLPDKLNRTD